MSTLIAVKTYDNRMEAEADKGRLEDGGIRAMVAADDCGGAYPQMTFTAGVKLLVNEQDAEKSKEILEAA